MVPEWGISSQNQIARLRISEKLTVLSQFYIHTLPSNKNGIRLKVFQLRIKRQLHDTLAWALLPDLARY